ncbi:alpha/beta hydrolase family protein [Stakelama tenebrarum]|uniref:S9 family peptidase n=1 Tax=Stakelama tenebrarum TaxID=2711215 RepID=A0A6G6Y3N5_9SPHN|nr:S9 family peptidase [Sphingosinithalassobacter tenebrarum]QIG79176.1 S9 family peptidase [Sphingosinithalassobacter tenebrarum]
MSFRVFSACALAIASAVALPIATVATIPAATAQTAPHPTEDFALLPLMEDPELSPDGSKIAVKLAIQGEQYFAVIPIGGGQPSIAGLEGNELNWFTWVNNDWVVAGVGGKMLIRRYGEVYVTRAVGISAADGEIVQLAPPRSHGLGVMADDLVWVASDGSPRVRIAMQASLEWHQPSFWPQVYEFDVSTGDQHLIASGREGVVQWSADHSGAVRMGLGYEAEGRHFRLLYRDDDHSGFKEVLRERSNDRSVVIPDAFLGDTAIAMANGPDGYTGVYEYDVANLTTGERIFGKDGYDVSAVRFTPEGNGIAAIYYTAETTNIVWVDERLKALDAEVRALVHGGDISIQSFSENMQRAIVRVGASDSPGAWYLYDRPSGQMAKLGDVNAGIGLQRLHPVTTVTYEARDGVEISAVLTLPRGKSSDLPLIVLPHGGPAARDYERWDWWTQFLADRGYAVIQPNYRGSTGFGQRFEDLGRGEWGLKMQDDLNDAVTYLAGEGTIDPSRVCIAGASYGGYAAMRAAQRDPSLYRCAISYAGVSDVDAMLKYDRSFLSGARGDWLREQVPDMKSVSPLNFPEQFGIPILIMHGKEDKTVPYEQSRDMARQLQRANKPVVYIEQEEGDHHFSRQEDRLEFLQAMESFLAKHNPAD